MNLDLTNTLVIGISSRALFDLEAEDRIYQEQGLEAYRRYQIENESVNLQPGTGFHLVRALLQLNQLTPGRRLVEVVIMSRNSSETSLRFFNSISDYRLDITRAALTGGASLAPYLKAFNVSLFLSLHREDVFAARESGVASAMLYRQPTHSYESLEQIRIAFDGDAVIFSDEAEKVYQQHGVEAFVEHERRNAKKPLPEGPFARFLKAIAYIQRQESGKGRVSPIRTALVTARSSPMHERVVRTLRAWDVVIDETFFMGGSPKGEVLAAFNPHMFFDDQLRNCENTADKVPTGLVVYAS